MHLVLSDDKSVAGYEQGMVNEEKIRRLVPDFSQRDAYICGPQPMILALEKILRSIGLGRERIHFELFSF
jgi:ring-1,2-phenylacetyl-CoA epoxidase subunit PaaE